MTEQDKNGIMALIVQVTDGMKDTQAMINGNRLTMEKYMVKQDALNARLVKVIDGNGDKPLPVRLASLESGVRRLQKADEKAGDRGFQVVLAVARWAVPAIVTLITLAIGGFVAIQIAGAGP